MKSAIAFTHAALVALLLSLPVAAQAPSDEVTLRTDQGRERHALAVPPFVGDEETDRVVRGTLRDDLAFSGLFDVMAGDDGAPYRVEATIEATGESRIVTFSLRQVDGDRVLTARRLRGTQETMRRMGHLIADEIVKAFFGREGAFDTRIAYVHGEGRSRDIYVMDYDGQTVTRITSDAALVLSPEVSQDGKLLLFTSYVGGTPAVYLITRQTGDINRLFQKEGLNQSPSFAPDGKHVAISAAFDGNSDIHVSDFSGKQLRRLTDDHAIDVSPTWSPSGKEIAFCSDRTGTPQIHVMTSEGLDVRRLTNEGSYNGEPTWSPFGERIAYSSRQAGRFQIAVMDLASGDVEYLTTGSNNESPAWSPDGEYLAFASDRDGSYDIYVMRRDGSNIRRVGPGGTNRFPSWYR